MPGFHFNPNDLHRLNRLIFAVPVAASDSTSGSHRTRFAGEGVDFLDFRPYSEGDDCRQVDWTVYGRLRQLFVRLNETSRQLCVSLLVDCSQSMMFGSACTKLEQAQKVACGLAYVALRNGDRLNLCGFSRGLHDMIGPLTGVRSVAAVVRQLSAMPAGGPSDLMEAARHLCAMRRQRGLVIILSDFLNVVSCEEAISMILSRGGKVLVVQILDDLDYGKGLKGLLRLRDSESGRAVDIAIDALSLEAYQAEFERRRCLLERFLLQRRQSYLRASTGDDALELICRALRAKAVVR